MSNSFRPILMATLALAALAAPHVCRAEPSVAKPSNGVYETWWNAWTKGSGQAAYDQSTGRLKWDYNSNDGHKNGEVQAPAQLRAELSKLSAECEARNEPLQRKASLDGGQTFYLVVAGKSADMNCGKTGDAIQSKIGSLMPW
jgi:hypothetical protein